MILTPVADPTGDWGMGVVSTESIEDARSIGDADPAVLAGVGRYEVRELPGAMVPASASPPARADAAPHPARSAIRLSDSVSAGRDVGRDSRGDDGGGEVIDLGDRERAAKPKTSAAAPGASSPGIGAAMGERFSWRVGRRIHHDMLSLERGRRSVVQGRPQPRDEVRRELGSRRRGVVAQLHPADRRCSCRSWSAAQAGRRKPRDHG